MSETVAVILAAGEGKRMGAGIPKALLEYEKGRSFLAQLLSMFAKAGCTPLAVLGASAEEVSAHHPGLEFALNERWTEGQLSSVRVGLRMALELGAERVLVHPVDMPLIRANTVGALLKAFSSKDAAVPVFEGAPGHPLLLSRSAAERVLERVDVPHLEAALEDFEVQRVTVKDPAVLLDINTPEVHERLLSHAPRRAPAPRRRVRATPDVTTSG